MDTLPECLGEVQELKSLWKINWGEKVPVLGSLIRAVGHKPEPLCAQTLTWHLSLALNDLHNSSAWETYKPEQAICIIYSNFLEFQMLITIHLHLIQHNSR